jgi:hypothetical protein
LFASPSHHKAQNKQDESGQSDHASQWPHIVSNYVGSATGILRDDASIKNTENDPNSPKEDSVKSRWVWVRDVAIPLDKARNGKRQQYPDASDDYKYSSHILFSYQKANLLLYDGSFLPEPRKTTCVK